MPTSCIHLTLVAASLGLVACAPGTRDMADFGSGGPSTESAGSGPTSGNPGASTSGGTTDGGSGGIKYDVGDDGGQCDCGTTEWSHIWLADSQAGYVSKLDTRTNMEVGRFLTRPDGDGDPSRTSVSLSGKAVAVANRRGGLIKIWTDEKFCEDKNSSGTIETSTGPNNLLPWGEDECVAWYTPFPELTTQRPVAWAPGHLDPQSCTYENERVWTAGCGGGNTPGHGGSAPGITVYRVDGATGQVADQIELPDFPCGSYGPYGGAVDSQGNFFVVSMNGALARVTGDTLEATTWPIGHPPLQPYGITVDRDDRVWISSYSEWSSPRPAYGAGRFDPLTETWDYVDEPFSSQSGIAQGADGKIWIATHWLGDAGGYNTGGTKGSKATGILWIDPDNLTIGDHWEIPVWIKGVSVDKDGFVWGVGWQTDNQLFTEAEHYALKIDPDSGQYSKYEGLDKPYTYSDMTGWGLQNVACTPEG